MSSYQQIAAIVNGKISDVDTTPWWVHQQMFEVDYLEDETYKARERHHREQQEMNALRRAANERDKQTRLRKGH